MSCATRKPTKCGVSIFRVRAPAPRRGGAAVMSADPPGRGGAETIQAKGRHPPALPLARVRSLSEPPGEQLGPSARPSASGWPEPISTPGSLRMASQPAA
jgi:hypothetical protein